MPQTILRYTLEIQIDRNNSRRCQPGKALVHLASDAEIFRWLQAFLDLIDNSVNAALEPFAEKLQTADDYAEILDKQDVRPNTDIKLTISTEKIEIVDTAPGISLEAARHHVFKFGRSQDEENESDRLSVYGLGLKRAFLNLAT